MSDGEGGSQKNLYTRTAENSVLQQDIQESTNETEEEWTSIDDKKRKMKEKQRQEWKQRQEERQKERDKKAEKQRQREKEKEQEKKERDEMVKKPTEKERQIIDYLAAPLGSRLLPDALLSTILSAFWFNNPFKNSGFILEG